MDELEKRKIAAINDSLAQLKEVYDTIDEDTTDVKMLAINVKKSIGLIGIMIEEIVDS